MKNHQLWEARPVLKLAVLSQWNSGHLFNRHCHSFYELGIVLSGECDWKVGKGARLTLRRGEAVLIKPNALHHEEVRPGKKAGLAWVGFEFEGKSPAWAHRVLSLGGDFAEIAHTVQAIYREHHHADARSRLRVRLAMQTLLLLVARQTEGERGREGSKEELPPVSTLNARQARSMESAAHYFRENLQRPLTIAQVAAYHSFCPAYFSTLFLRHFGMAPRAFLQESRLQKAADFLRGSDLALKEIAAECGFVDSAHLCKSFKRKWGVTPKKFRGEARA